MLGRTFPHHPAHRIDDIGFTATIGPDNRSQIAADGNSGRIDKGFETRKFDFFQFHDWLKYSGAVYKAVYYRLCQQEFVMEFNFAFIESDPTELLSGSCDC